jgi:hypothetical protein
MVVRQEMPVGAESSSQEVDLNRIAGGSDIY